MVFRNKSHTLRYARNGPLTSASQTTDALDSVLNTNATFTNSTDTNDETDTDSSMISPNSTSELPSVEVGDEQIARKLLDDELFLRDSMYSLNFTKI